MSHPKYEAIPMEEKVMETPHPGEGEKTSTTPQLRERSSRGKRCLALVAAAILSITTLLAFLDYPQISTYLTGSCQDAEPVEDFLARATAASGQQQYLLGVGKADITGPVVELNFMGYASLSQIGTGLRQRIYSRAFIIGNVDSPNDRFVYLVLDTQSGDTAIRYGILSAVAALGPDYAMYGQGNVAVTGTHQHSGPGAWLNYLLPQITSLGFSKQSYQAIVDGATLSIKRAHESLAPGYLSYADTNITDANINRSLWAYLANPAEERAQYETTTDTTLTMLRFQRASDGLNTGVLAWHSVHGTSMLENNTHVTGDNKGVSSYLFEQAMASDASAAPGFVAGFSQSSVGDTTPNVLGAWCDDGSGQQCTLEKSTCGDTNTSKGTSQACHGRGPFFDKLDLGVSSCYEIGRRVFQGAKDLYDSFDSVATPITDPAVKSYHTFQDMQYMSFALPNGTTVQTCPAALGYSFAGGTSDGPGAFDFVQGDNSSSPRNPLWQVVSGLISTPSPKQVACQGSKPILLNVGELHTPYDWSPSIIDVQSLRVGNLIMIISPSEATTMAGRRWKAAVASAAAASSITLTTPKVVLGGPANTYAHYCTTPEEYGIQRYEGASTLYGPWQSYAYMYLSTANIGYLSSSNTSQPPSGPLPPNNAGTSLSFISSVVYDNAPLGKSFGQVLAQPAASYPVGATVNTTFVGANPRNNLRLEGTFAAVQQLQADGKTWLTVRDDKDWHLVYTWTRTNGVLGNSEVVISWETGTKDAQGRGDGTQPGTYRVVYNGDSKTPLLGSITSFTGMSRTFTIS